MKRELHVLLVEDSENDALLLMREIERHGYEPKWHRVQTAQDMADALGRQFWDVIIADYCLPAFSAPAALRLLQDRELDIPFIVVSGLVDEKIAVETMRAGAHDCVMKNNMTRLVAAIEREMREVHVRAGRRQAEEEVKNKSLILEESNITLKNVLMHIEGEKTTIKEQIRMNIEKNIKPLIEELKNNTTPDQNLVYRLEENVNHFDSVFHKKMTGQKLKLTPTEVKICQLIKSGYQAKEIAEMMNIAYSTVTHHKKNIRNKLGLQNTAINLHTYLNEIES